MKTEQGLVIEVIDEEAQIKVGRHNDCKNCGACPGNDSVIIIANNQVGAKPGQRVLFEVKEKSILKAAFIVFILPLVALFTGVMLGGVSGEYIGINIRMLQIMGGIIAFLLSLAVIKVFDKATSKSDKSKPVIVRIL